MGSPHELSTIAHLQGFLAPNWEEMFDLIPRKASILLQVNQHHILFRCELGPFTLSQCRWLGPSTLVKSGCRPLAERALLLMI